MRRETLLLLEPHIVFSFHRLASHCIFSYYSQWSIFYRSCLLPLHLYSREWDARSFVNSNKFQTTYSLDETWIYLLFLLAPVKQFLSQTLMRGITALRSTVVSDPWNACDIKIVIDITHLKYAYLLVCIGSTWNKPHPYCTRLCFKKNWKEAQCSEPVKSRVPSKVFLTKN